jgi:hypothetical protein
MTEVDNIFEDIAVDQHDSTVMFRFPKELEKCDDNTLKKIMKSSPEINKLLLSTKRPLAVERKKEKETDPRVIEIVANHSIFRLQKTTPEKPIRLRLLKNADIYMEAVRNLDAAEKTLVESLVDNVDKPVESKGITGIRTLRLQQEQICISCIVPVPLMGPRFGTPVTDPLMEKLIYRAACHNTGQVYEDGRKRCDFCAYLTEYEYLWFMCRKHPFPTSLWLSPVDGECEDCGGKLYLRTIHFDAAHEEKWIMCRNYLSIHSKCKNARRLDQCQLTLKI